MRNLRKALIFLLQKINFLYKEIEKLIFPQCCLICGKLVNNILCKTCKQNILKNQNAKIEIKDKEKYFFEKHAYLFFYKGEIRKLIIDYKFNDKPYLYKLFSQIIIKNKKIYGILKKYDIIMPVPVHKIRKMQRGYNQSELIAKEISKQIDELKLEKDVLKKIKNNKPQSLLNKEQRKANVENIYKIYNKEKVKNKNIVLFDDIYTTGNTVKALAKILKENGAKEILILTIAKD